MSANGRQIPRSGRVLDLIKAEIGKRSVWIDEEADLDWIEVRIIFDGKGDPRRISVRSQSAMSDVRG